MDGNNSLTTAHTQYRARDAPHYTLGHAVVLAYIALGLVMAATYRTLLVRENARRERGERDERIDPAFDPALVAGEGEKGEKSKNGTYASVAAARRDKGDEWSGYRYTL